NEGKDHCLCEPICKFFISGVRIQTGTPVAFQADKWIGIFFSSGSFCIAPVGFKRFQNLFTQKRSKDRKSTRLNSSHVSISYAVFCLKKKNKKIMENTIKHARNRISQPTTH